LREIPHASKNTRLSSESFVCLAQRVDASIIHSFLFSSYVLYAQSLVFFWREKRAASTIKLQRVPSFSPLGHGIRCFRKEARPDAKKDAEKVYSSDGFPQGSRGCGFSFRDPREILALEVWRSTASLLYLKIKSSKIRLFLQTRDLMYLVQNQDTTSKSQRSRIEDATSHGSHKYEHFQVLAAK